MSDVTIVQLKPHDWQQYKALRLRALKEDPLAFGTSYEEMAVNSDEYWTDRLEEAQNTNKQLMVFAKKDGALVGMMTARFHKPDIAQLHAVFVVPEARGLGVGSQLMETLLRLIKQNPQVKKAYLDVNQNQIAAIGLYEKFGFQIVDETLQPLSDGQNHPVYVMFRAI